MKTLYTFLKAAVCLFVLSCLMPTESLAMEDLPAEEIITVASSNPIMVIRCRRVAPALTKELEKNAINSKTIEGPVPPPGYIFGENGGLIPNCNFLSSSPNTWVYNSDNGMCECDFSVSTDCSDFCADDIFSNMVSNVISRVPIDIDTSCDIYLCPGENADTGVQGTLFGNEYFPSNDTYILEEGECVTACFDGELNVDIPVFDCSALPNDFGHIPVEICFTSADASNPLLPGQRVPIADIQNCFDDAGQALLSLAITANGNNVAGDGEEYYFDEVVDDNGMLCVDFFVNPDEPLIIDFTNSTEVVIPTCFEDPCSCDNPNIVENGAVVRFFDVLSNLGPLPAGGSVTLVTNNNPDGFTNAAGTPITDGSVLVNAIPMNGSLDFEFYRASGEAADILLEVADASGNTTTQRYISPMVCDAADCPVIPTMGQWALFVLGLLLTSLGVVYIRRRSMSKA